MTTSANAARSLANEIRRTLEMVEAAPAVKLETEIPQGLLARYLRLKTMAKDLSAEVAGIGKSVMEALEKGVTVEVGALTAEIECRDGVRKPKWKEVVGDIVEERGEFRQEFYARILANTAPGSETKFLKVE